MNASSRLFKAKEYGTCAICRTRISIGALIVRLEKPIAWIESKRLIPRGGGRFFTAQRSSQYVHGDCLEEYKEAKDEEN